ncbi:hypothetical protein [Paractinoplanes lichenicola]|uniref:Uncharacterized protein n=1 Tax=Paractinoplanes lichenicola TaxID=2802976 RepID=A0ABS1W014_9ACTN|nr:hypothetical protein [Actinoplanes lichenicola]MBL7260081.1 hypothetical protein [Actinoplanes lichenicola]
MTQEQVLLGSLTENELMLVRATDAAALAGLDEDELLALHQRIRRARDKYVKVYRRRAAARVDEVGARGRAFPKNTRSRGKAEIFEDALARVSDAVASAARASVLALRAERLAEAQQPGNPVAAGPLVAPAAETREAQRSDRRPDHGDLPKRHAATRATGARRQARRDSR